jgi:hypothetical protein
MILAVAIAACGGETNASDDDATTSDGTGGSVVSGSGAGGSSSSSPATTSGNGGGGEAPAGKVPVFIAQGSMGRTTISCDDGASWVADRAWDSDGDPLMCSMVQSAVCYESQCSYSDGNQCEQRLCCDHSADVAKGVIWGGDKFVATWGWGMPGAVRTSSNGIDWTTTHPNDTFGGIAYGSGRFVVASRSPYFSSDGQTWSAGSEADFSGPSEPTIWSVRRFAYADYKGEGRFVAVASGNTDRDILVSSDGGANWWRPASIPDDCAGEVSTYGGIVSGNDTIVIVDQAANACRSTDGGNTWTVAPTGLDQILSHGVWTGSEFWFWGDDGFRVSSSDGLTWTKTPMTTPERLGPVARSPEGTLVAVGNVWQGYDQLSFFRSEDGLAWEPLVGGKFEASHPIFYLSFGYAEPSAACPLP